MATLNCEIITPEGRVFGGEVEMVVVPGAEGELGIMPRHQSIFAKLETGQVRVRVSATEWKAFATADGYISMQANKAMILVEGAVAADAIDVAAANEKASDARLRIEQSDAGDTAVNRFRAERDLEYAENLLALADR